MPIQTSTFIIRNFLLEEETIYVDLLADLEVAIYLPKRTRVENAEMFRTAIADYKLHKPLNRWGIFSLGNDFMGMCLIRAFDAEHILEVGYSFHQKYWGKGLATEVVKYLIKYSFEELNAEKVVAVTALENVASQKVLQKSGLKRAANVNRYEQELSYFEVANKGNIIDIL
ncbi:MAG: GNAT family N-acetyltransferase [Janthinobacterium lividum]